MTDFWACGSITKNKYILNKISMWILANFISNFFENKVEFLVDEIRKNAIKQYDIYND
jgi:hypothetical protein